MSSFSLESLGQPALRVKENLVVDANAALLSLVNVKKECLIDETIDTVITKFPGDGAKQIVQFPCYLRIGKETYLLTETPLNEVMVHPSYCGTFPTGEI